MNDLRTLPIQRIFQRRNSRLRSCAALDALSGSIACVGLLSPITVRARDSGYEVVAGAHRLQACELLGHTEISCVVMKVDDLRADLATIDENLVRTELSPSERAMQTARRKAIYETLHPQTKAYVAGAYGSNAAQGNVVASVAIASFADDLAAKAGIAARSVRHDAERGDKIAEAALARLSGTRLDTGRFLDELKRIPPAGQVAHVEEQLARERRPPAPAAAKVDLHRPTGSGTADRAVPAVSVACRRDRKLRDRGAHHQQRPPARNSGQRAASAAERLNAIVEGIRR